LERDFYLYLYGVTFLVGAITPYKDVLAMDFLLRDMSESFKSYRYTIIAKRKINK